MESHENVEFTSVIDNLVSMFGHIVTKEVISTVVESCEGDLNLSVDAIMDLTSEQNILSVTYDGPSVNEETNATVSPPQSGPSVSHAVRCSQSSGTTRKQSQPKNMSASFVWTEQFRRIISLHNEGTRVMILMRGLPGSGKSHLAASLLESMLEENYKSHIFTTDDYFMVRGQYMYNVSKLSTAHSWNQDRVRQACVSGRSPIVVDNTNIELWEMHPYLIHGVNNGYVIEVVEMNTPWAKKAYQLCKKNKHGVPYHVIKRKLDSYIEGVTGESLLRSFRLSYPLNMVPPIKRLLPLLDEDTSIHKSVITSTALNTMSKTHVRSAEAFKGGDNEIPTTGPLSCRDHIQAEKSTKIPKDQSKSSEEEMSSPDSSSQLTREPMSCSQENSQPVAGFQEISDPVTTSQEKSPLASSFQDQQNQNPIKPDSNDETCQPVPLLSEKSQLETVSSSPYQLVYDDDDDDLILDEQLKLFKEAKKRVEKMEKFEIEWENGKEWNDNDQEVVSINSILKRTRRNTSKSIVEPSSSYITNLHSKPPRKSKNLPTDLRSEGSIQSVNDYNYKHYWFIPPWIHPQKNPNIDSKLEAPIETISSSTSVEIGDTDLFGNHKVLTAIPRDINEFYVAVAPEREKIPQKRMLDKSSMTNEGILMSFHCPQKERHFVLLRQLFMHIERESLRDIFDNCCGDPNWAVESILGGGVKYTLKNKEGEDDSDLEEESDASYEMCTCLANYNIIPDVYKSDAPQVLPTAGKMDKNSSRLLPNTEKKRLDAGFTDQNIQLKRQIEQNIVISDGHYSEHCLKIRKFRRGEDCTDDNISEQLNTSGMSEVDSSCATNSSMMSSDESSSDDDNVDSDSSGSDSRNDKIINVNVGRSFIKHLDEMFDRKDMEYPENIAFNLSIPTSLLNELNALWIESLTFQLDDLTRNTANMIKEDEELARQITLKEEELILHDKEPDVPDLKEIMDLESAISVHKKKMSKWRNKIPKDIAAKMTQNKLFNLFPDIEKELLLEMLIAHDNDFKATVEVVLTSMGRKDVLNTENGVNKFVVEKELEHQEKLKKEKKMPTDIEWPPVTQTDEEINMETVEGYRTKATHHLNFLNMSKQKSEDFTRRGMPEVATYYADVAKFHRMKAEQANGKAVTSLIQYHSKNNSSYNTVDLHYFRVKEAKEAMDVFIDTQIQKLHELKKSEVNLFFITGRGLHSPGRPRVKPACAKRLRQRGLRYTECNPGLLRARVTIHDKLTFQLL